MNKYDVILEYTTSRDMLLLLDTDNIIKAINNALDDAILYKDVEYIASITVMINNDKEKICKR